MKKKRGKKREKTPYRLTFPYRRSRVHEGRGGGTKKDKFYT